MKSYLPRLFDMKGWPRLNGLHEDGRWMVEVRRTKHSHHTFLHSIAACFVPDEQIDELA